MRQRNANLPMVVGAAVVLGATAALGQIQAMPPYQTPIEPHAAPAYAAGQLGPHGGSAAAAPHETLSWDESAQIPISAYSAIPADPASMQSDWARSGSSYPAGERRVTVALDVDYWTWQVVPEGIIYKSYLAGVREPRMGTQWFHERGKGWLWDSTLGGRVGLIRYGTTDAAWPEGWQLDFEGAAFPRLDLKNHLDMISADFRFGFPLTYRRGPWEWKFSHYHLSSHLGDEYLERYPDAHRVNFVRETLVLGLALRPHPDWRLYGEVGYAVWVDGGSEPWEFQFGIDYSPIEPSGFRGAPFLAVNAHLREEVDFGGDFTARAGWQWRGDTGNLFRVGAHYFNGMSSQHQFFSTFEEQLGVGLWYDF